MDNSLLIIVDHKHQILSILTQINYGSNTEQISLYPDVDSGLTQSGLEPMIYHIRGEQANHFTNDGVDQV
jgi:hypothetical protein